MTSYLDYDGLETLVGEIEARYAPRSLVLDIGTTGTSVCGVLLYASDGTTSRSDFGSVVAEISADGYTVGEPFCATGDNPDGVGYDGYCIATVTEAGVYRVAVELRCVDSGQFVECGFGDGTYDYGAFTTCAERYASSDGMTLAFDFVADVEAGEALAAYAKTTHGGWADTYPCRVEIRRIPEGVATASMVLSQDSNDGGGTGGE